MKISNIVLQKVPFFNGTFNLAIKYTYSGYDKNLLVYYGPTGNCQWLSIRSFEDLLRCTNEEMTVLLQTVFKDHGKPLFLVDVLDQWVEELKNRFTEDEILMTSPYISTNGSKLTMFLIKSEKFKTK